MEQKSCNFRQNWVEANLYVLRLCLRTYKLALLFLFGPVPSPLDGTKRCVIQSDISTLDDGGSRSHIAGIT